MRDNDGLLIGFVAVILIIVAVILAVKKSNAQQECVDNGGIVNEYDCGEHGCSKWQCVYHSEESK